MRKIKTVVELLDYRNGKFTPTVSEVYRGKAFDLPTMTKCSVDILGTIGKSRTVNASTILKRMTGANSHLNDRGKVTVSMTPEYSISIRKYNYRVKSM